MHATQFEPGSGNAYGYDVVRETGADGKPIRGKRQINEAKDAVVRRIFDEFAAGRSPKIIAHTLNHDHVPAPAGRAWGRRPSMEHDLRIPVRFSLTMPPEVLVRRP